ncbi:hypothetical protein DNTS_017240 [Danionella cerebrum]|uniref:Uncharacterized protein n=1 Tax=Danionella cerebrum TaxID=2873325 RepID=A0A553R1M3_9TELE|nr:hypothetical protein DNTS_017240 [Danionella translucida]
MSLVAKREEVIENQFAYQEGNFGMEEMMATIPRVVAVSAVSPGCSAQKQSKGQQGASGTSEAFEDSRCNGTLRKKASPRASTGEDSSGQRYSADPTAVLCEDPQDPYASSMQDKKPPDFLSPVEENPFVTLRRNGETHRNGVYHSTSNGQPQTEDEYVNDPLYLNTFHNSGEKSHDTLRKNGILVTHAAAAGAASGTLVAGNTGGSNVSKPMQPTASSVQIPTQPIYQGKPSISILSGHTLHSTHPGHTLHPTHTLHPAHSGTIKADTKPKKTFDSPDYWQHSLPPKATLHNPEYLQDCSTRFFYRQNGRIRPAVAENQEYLADYALKPGTVLPPPPYRQRNTVV